MSKVIIVTGGTSGIGAEICRTLKQQNYIPIANYLNDLGSQDFAQKEGIEIAQWDVSNHAQCVEGVQKLIDKYGQIYGLINNAGITQDAMLHKMTEAQWQKVIDVNLTGCFNMSHAVITHMRNNNIGRIINIASVNALTGQVGQCNYAASKAGIIGFSKSLAQESARKNITVNCIAPGYIATNMTKAMPEEALEAITGKILLGALGQTADIAKGVCYLLESGYITGSTLHINGGLNMA